MALVLLALMPATAGNLDFSLGSGDRGAAAPVAAPAANGGEPAWQSNPFAYPLLQAPGSK